MRILLFVCKDMHVPFYPQNLEREREIEIEREEKCHKILNVLCMKCKAGVAWMDLSTLLTLRVWLASLVFLLHCDGIPI